LQKKNSLFHGLRLLSIVIMFFSAINISICSGQVTAQLSGIIENSYRSSESESNSANSTKSEQNEYIQNYQLGLSGFAISPNFMTYFLGSTYRKSRKGYGGSTIASTSFDWYDVSSRFFKNRPYSFDLFARKTESLLTAPDYSQVMFTNLYGGEVRLSNQHIPRTRLGYRYSNTRGIDTNDADIHITSVNVEKGSKYTSVEGTFRDEQKTYLVTNRMTRLQEIQLRGTTRLVDHNAQLSSEANYSSYSGFATTRVNLRFQGAARERDRFFALYSFNNVQNNNYQSFVNTAHGDYRRYISTNVNMAFNTRIQRNLYRGIDLSSKSGNEDFGSGIEYLSTVMDSIKTFRKFGTSFLRLRHATPGEFMPGIDGVGTLEWGRQYPGYAQMTNTISAGYSYFKSIDSNPYSTTLEYAITGSVRPVRIIDLQKRLTVRLNEGSTYRRSILDRSTIAFMLHRNFNFSVTGTIDYTIAPDDRILYYITTMANWYLRRDLNWQNRTSWTYNPDLNTEYFWLESSLNYRYGKVNTQLLYVEKYFQGRSTRSVFLNVARLIGSGYARQI
jgi:hypothetical protein